MQNGFGGGGVISHRGEAADELVGPRPRGACTRSPRSGLADRARGPALCGSWLRLARPLLPEAGCEDSAPPPASSGRGAVGRSIEAAKHPRSATPRQFAGRSHGVTDCRAIPLREHLCQCAHLVEVVVETRHAQVENLARLFAADVRRLACLDVRRRPLPHVVVEGFRNPLP